VIALRSRITAVLPEKRPTVAVRVARLSYHLTPIVDAPRRAAQIPWQRAEVVLPDEGMIGAVAGQIGDPDYLTLVVDCIRNVVKRPAEVPVVHLPDMPATWPSN
jgi:hypothetical protein